MAENGRLSDEELQEVTDRMEKNELAYQAGRKRGSEDAHAWAKERATDDELQYVAEANLDDEKSRYDFEQWLLRTLFAYFNTVNNPPGWEQYEDSEEEYSRGYTDGFHERGRAIWIPRQQRS